jgi:hypothetical protein
MSGRSWLRRLAAIMAGFAIGLFFLAPSALSKKAPTPTPTPTETPTATPTPEAKVWNFDGDKANVIAKGWSASEGNWIVMPDATAPSPPNTYGLPAGRMIGSILHGLNYNLFTVQNDPTEYGDFKLEVDFKAKKGYFDCSGGLVFRYANAQNFYVLGAGCPSDNFALYREYKGAEPEMLKQTVTPIDEGTWYRLKVIAEGNNLACYLNDKLILDMTDSKIAKGRVGMWAKDDSQAHFDNFSITVTQPGESAAGGTTEAAPSSMPGSELPPSLPSGPSAPPPPLPK